jgi:AcrR family transcriptional regulator
MKTRRYHMTDRAENVEETRQRIIRASRSLFAQRWFDDVTLGQLAEAAGVSHQTVLNHFHSKEGVFGAVLALVEAEVVEEDDRAAVDDTSAAIRRLLRRYERMGLENARFVVQEHRSAVLHEVLERARAQHRGWVEQVFAHCLAPSGPQRRRKIAALIAATEVMAWKAVRHDYGFSRADTVAAMTATVKGIEEGL